MKYTLEQIDKALSSTIHERDAVLADYCLGLISEEQALEKELALLKATLESSVSMKDIMGDRVRKFRALDGSLGPDTHFEVYSSGKINLVTTGFENEHTVKEIEQLVQNGDLEEIL